MIVKKLRRLQKLLKFLQHPENEPVLTGFDAWSLGPEKGKPQKDHSNIYLKEGEFTYWSAEESSHNGDYYDAHADLGVTIELLDMCLLKFETRALEKLVRTIEQEEKDRRKKLAQRRLKALLA